MFWLIVLGGLTYYLWRTHETWLGWYFSLTPHPAAEMVERTIRGGGDIDGDLFAAVMRPVPGNPIEQRVRAEQAQRLAAMARSAAADRLAQLERERQRMLQDAAFLAAQDELRSAAEAHEIAKAKLDAVRQWRDRHGG